MGVGVWGVQRAIVLAPLVVLAALAPKAALAAPEMTFHEAVERAWSLLPDRRNFDARTSVAAARARSGSALFPNAPSLTASHINDKILGSNQNYITTQAELATPVWLPGEGSATVATARADADTARADAEAAHLALAAQILDLVVQAQTAEDASHAAAKRLATARSLATDADRRARIGEQAQTDALAADAEASKSENALATAEADAASATAALSALLGSDALARLPSTPTAPGATDEALLAHHPRILAGQRAVQAAEANARLVRIANRDDPEIGVQGIDEKQPGTRWDTRFGVTLRFSFATEARNAPRRAMAEQQVTQAMVQLDLARREILAQLRAQRATLIGAERAAPAAARAAEALDSRRGKIDRAWRLGEAPLVEVVRADALAYDADLARDRARLALAAARVRLALARGQIP